MWHRHIPFVAILLAALFSVAADKAKEHTPSPEQIQTWIKQLGDHRYKVREEATRDLIKAGGVTFDAVAKATKSKDPEVKHRALSVLRHEKFNDWAIAYFKKLGGKVTVDEKSPGKPVIELDLMKTKINDAGLVYLKVFNNLRLLDFQSTDITDEGLVHLNGLSKLGRLWLIDTKVTQAGIETLKKTLPNTTIRWEGK